MRLRFSNSITFKMTLLVLGCTSLVFSLILGYNYSYSRKIILDEAEIKARNLTLSVANKIEQEFRAITKIPQHIVSFLKTNDYNKTTLDRIIREMVEDNPEVFGSTVGFEPNAFEEGVQSYSPYYYRTTNGLNYLQLGSASYNYFQRDWYHIPKVLKAPVWIEPYFHRRGGGIIMTAYSVPLLESAKDSAATKVKAIVSADVSLEWLTWLVASMRLGRTGYGFIMSDIGTIVTHPREEWIMRQSIFSLADEYGDSRLRRIGRAMIREKSGFTELGSTLTGEDAFIAYARIPSPGWSLGAVFPRSEIFEEVCDLYERTVLLAGLGLVLLLIASAFVARSMARPLLRMSEATRKVVRGDLDIDLSDIRRKDEVGQLARDFTRMAAGLQERDRIRDTFGRYLTQEVVDRLLESKDGLRLGGESREISMIMSDLRGFTALTSNRKPEEVINLLNRYLGKMVDILMEYRGIIDEIIGDGILAFFGAPEPMENHAASAVACALKMQAAMEEVNESNEAEGLPRLEMGVAVNTGEVIVGNIGSEKRSKYGAVGSQVNFTGRAESFTVGGQVLITKATYEELSDILRVRKVLKVEMKGMSGKVELYDITGIGEPYNVYLPENEETLVAVREMINVEVYRLDEKVVTESGTTARITHISSSSAIIVLHEKLSQWENVRLQLLNNQLAPVPGKIYAKVVSVARVDDNHKAEVHFTSVSPEAEKVFRQRLGKK